MISSEALVAETPSTFFTHSQVNISQYMDVVQPSPSLLPSVSYHQGMCGMQIPQPYHSYNAGSSHPIPYQNPSVSVIEGHRFGNSTSETQHHALPASVMDSCQQITHVLQCYEQGGEDPEFVRKAIDSLVRKLKDKRVELDALITAITSSGKQPTICVTIQRSLDGRLQVAGRKGVPHVVYARIWRWPNVSKNELVLSMCVIPMDHQDFICVNPYHYERVVSNGLAPLDMKTLRVETPHMGLITKNDYQMQDFSEIIEPIGDNVIYYLSTFIYILFTRIFISDYSCWGPPSSALPQQKYSPRRLQHLTKTNSPAVHTYDYSQVQMPIIPQLPDDWCSIMYYELDTQIGETLRVRHERNMVEVSVDGGMDPHAARNGRFCLGALPNVHRGEVSEKCRYVCGQLAEFYITVNFYLFKDKQALKYVTALRIHIGHGVHLHSMPNGCVELECRSLKPIFIRSSYLDYCKYFPYRNKVHRLTAKDGRITVFDLRWAYQEMLRRTCSASQAIRAQAAAVAGFAPDLQMTSISEIVEDFGVDGMRCEFCSFAVSFVKGWGVGYPSRNSIKDTPCWIEVHLHRPLQLLDHLLKTNGPL
uniref:Mothers against decapentaplegic homolog n=1 Tax=Heterorhabditis bacteriophora TaxID=37862 RepID=A0A1I7X8P8_HETBA